MPESPPHDSATAATLTGVGDPGYNSYGPVFDARPPKRFLQRHLETRLARALIAGEVAEGATVTFKVKADELVMA